MRELLKGDKRGERQRGERQSGWLMDKVTEGRAEAGERQELTVSAKIIQADRQGEGAMKAKESDKRQGKWKDDKIMTKEESRWRGGV